METLKKEEGLFVPFEKVAVINKVVNGEEKDMSGYVELEEDGVVNAYVDGRLLVDSSGFPARFADRE